MEFWIKAAQLILSLSFLIVLHELGHFIPAKLFKTRVEKFYLFFNPWFSLFKVKKGETEYGLGWVPLGGYVKISGMIDESMDKEQMAKPAEPWEFRSKPVWQRLIIMIGGVTVNLILGLLIYMMILGVWGKDQIPPEALTYGYDVPEYFEEFGFRDGDIVTEVDGEPLENAMDINKLILVRGAQKFKVVHQDGTDTTITVPEDADFQAFYKDAVFTPRFPAEIDSVIADSPAEKAGIQKGDVVISANGSEVNYWTDMTNSFTDVRKDRRAALIALAIETKSYKETVKVYMQNSEELTYSIEIMRGNDMLSFTITPTAEGTIGVAPLAADKVFKIQHVDYGFGEAMASGFGYGLDVLGDYVAQLKFLGTEKGVSSMGGFGTFGSLFAPEWDWQIFWERTAFISIILAFMNILPIPALDGGHVMFLLYEMISGREPNQKVMEYAQLAGLVILLGLIIYANANDIIKAF